LVSVTVAGVMKHPPPGAPRPGPLEGEGGTG